MSKRNWQAAKRRRQQMHAAVREMAPLPESPRTQARNLGHHLRFQRSGDRGVSARGAQGCDAYARRNYTKITLPKLKFLEGKEDGQ